MPDILLEDGAIAVDTTKVPVLVHVHKVGGEGDKGYGLNNVPLELRY